MRACLGAAIAMLVLAGCGGGKDPEHKAFSNSMNAICRDDDVKLRRIPEPTTAAEIPAYVSGAVRVIRDEARRLARLDPPADQRENMRLALSILSQQVAAAQAMSRAGVAGDMVQINAINKTINRLHSQGRAVARKLGAKDCAQ